MSCSSFLNVRIKVEVRSMKSALQIHTAEIIELRIHETYYGSSSYGCSVALFVLLFVLRF